MLASLSNFISRQSLLKKVFLGIIALAILARVFVLFTMPDAPMTDSLYYFAITKYVIQNHALPFHGLPEIGFAALPVPFYPVLMAIPFAVLRVPFTLQAARIFPFVFSFLQLLVSFLLLRRIFPKNWVFGFAFVAAHPLLIVFGGLNYLETFASVLVLLCFFVYWRFVETGRLAFLLLMPFALAGMALSKESATVLVPAFFLAFLYEILRKKPAKAGRRWAVKLLYFAVVSVLLCSAWFLVNFWAVGTPSPSMARSVELLSSSQQVLPSLESIFLLPLKFNLGFWFFQPQGFEPIAQPELALIAFSLITFPLLCFLFYGMAKGAMKREKPAVLLLLCLALALILMAVRGRRFIHVRLLVPMLPLFGIAACHAFREFRFRSLRKAFAALFLLTVIYSVVSASFYAMHFNATYNDHLPLYNFIKELPNDSTIAIHPNKQRQITFIAGKASASFSSFQGLGPENLYTALKGRGVTHLAATCYKNPWDLETTGQLVKEGKLHAVFADKCSTLYELRK